MNANDATLTGLVTAPAGSTVADIAPNAPANPGFDLVVEVAAGSALGSSGAPYTLTIGAIDLTTVSQPWPTQTFRQAFDPAHGRALFGTGPHYQYTQIFPVTLPGKGPRRPSRRSHPSIRGVPGQPRHPGRCHPPQQPIRRCLARTPKKHPAITEVTMKIRNTIAAAAAAAAVSTTGPLVLPAGASAHSAAHTLTFVSVLKKLVIYTHTTVGEQDTDVTSTGKIIGFDELYATQTGPTTGKGKVAYAENGGLLYGTLILTHNGARGHGTVTGGTGVFRGATGTITFKPANKSGTRAAVTITYTT